MGAGTSRQAEWPPRSPSRSFVISAAPEEGTKRPPLAGPGQVTSPASRAVQSGAASAAERASVLHLMHDSVRLLNAWFSSLGSTRHDVIPSGGVVVLRAENAGAYHVNFATRSAAIGTPEGLQVKSTLTMRNGDVYRDIALRRSSPMVHFMSGAVSLRGDRRLLQAVFKCLALARQAEASGTLDAHQLQGKESERPPSSSTRGMERELAHGKSRADAAVIEAIAESVQVTSTTLLGAQEELSKLRDMCTANDATVLTLAMYGGVAVLLALPLWLAGAVWSLAAWLRVPHVGLAIAGLSFLYVACVIPVWAFPRSEYSRRARVFTVAAAILSSIWLVRTWAAQLTEADSALLWSRAHRWHARFAFNNIAYFKGLWVKVGQYLSSRADVMPPEFVAELKKVQDAMPATPIDEVKQVITKELGLDRAPEGALEAGHATPFDAAFESFSEAPIASASIAQVHRGVLRGFYSKQVLAGQVLAVKVQHPGVDVLMRNDLFDLGVIVAVVAFLEPDYDFRPVLSEFSKEAAKEVDLSREGRICRHVGRLLAQHELTDTVRTPKVFDVLGALHQTLGHVVPSADDAGICPVRRSDLDFERLSRTSIGARFRELSRQPGSPATPQEPERKADSFRVATIRRAESLGLWDDIVDCYSYFDADGMMVRRPFWLWGPTPAEAVRVATTSEAMDAPTKVLCMEFIEGKGLLHFAKDHVDSFVGDGEQAGRRSGEAMVEAALAPLLELHAQLAAGYSRGRGSTRDTTEYASRPASETREAVREVDAEGMMRGILDAFALQIYAAGCFHGDPHPGNILVEWVPHAGNGAQLVHRCRAVLLDFGLSKQLGDPMRLAFARMMLSTSSFDIGGLLDSFEDMGLKFTMDDPAGQLGMMKFVFRDVQPREQARASILRQRKEFRDMAARRRAANVKKPIESWPADLLFYMRSQEMLHGVGSSLGVSVPYVPSMVSAAADAVREAALADLLDSEEPSIHAHFAARPKGSKPRQSLSTDGWGGWAAGAGLYLAASGTAASVTPRSHFAIMPVIRPPPSPFPTLDAGAARSSTESAVLRLLRDLYVNGEVVGVQVAVVRGGNLVVDAAAGTVGPHDPRPMHSDTLVNCFSVTKGITSAALLMLMDASSPLSPASTRQSPEFARLDSAGAVLQRLQNSVKPTPPSLSSPVPSTRSVIETLRATGFTGPVCELGWPAFGTAGKNSCSMAHILAHQTGLHHALPEGVSLSMLQNSQDMESHLAQATPLFPPGSRTAYQYYTFGWLAAGVARALTGGLVTIGDIVRDVIAPAVGSEGEMFIGVPPGQVRALARAGRLAVLSGSLNPQGLTGGSAADAAAGKVGGGQGADVGAAAIALESMARDVEVQGHDPELAEEMRALASLIRRLKGREFLLEPRIFNKRSMRCCEIPSANGHFTARALAMFYSALPRLVSPQRLNVARLPLALERRLTNMFVQGSDASTPSAAAGATVFGLGFQVFGPKAANAAAVLSHAVTAAHSVDRADAQSTVPVPVETTLLPYGHSGFGGSLAFVDPKTDTAVAITVTQLSNGKGATKAIMKLLGDKLQLESFNSF